MAVQHMQCCWTSKFMVWEADGTASLLASAPALLRSLHIGSTTWRLTHPDLYSIYHAWRKYGISECCAGETAVGGKQHTPSDMQSQVQQLLTGLAHSMDAQTGPQLPEPPAGWSTVGPAQPSASHQQAACPADGSRAASAAAQAGQQAGAPTPVRAESGMPAEAAQPLLLPRPSTPAAGRSVDQGTMQCKPPAKSLSSDTLSIDPVAHRSEAAAIEGTAGRATDAVPPAQPSAGKLPVKTSGAACSSRPAVQPSAPKACGGLGSSSATISVDIVGYRCQAPAVCSSTTISVDIVGLSSQLPAQELAPMACGADPGSPPAEGTPPQVDTQQPELAQAGSRHVAAEATAEAASGAPSAGHGHEAPGPCQAAEGRQAQRAASVPLPGSAPAHSISRKRVASPAASKRRADSAPLTLPKVSQCENIREPQKLLAPASESAAAVAPMSDAGAQTVYVSAQSTVSTSVIQSLAASAGEMPCSQPGTAHPAHGVAATAAAAGAQAVAAALPASREGNGGQSAQRNAALQTQALEETHTVREMQHMIGASQKRRRSQEDEGTRKVARLERALKQINADASGLLSSCGGPSLQTAVTRQQRRERQPGRTLRGRQVTCRAAMSASPGQVLYPLPEVKALLDIAAAQVQPERSCTRSLKASMYCQVSVDREGGAAGQPAQAGAAEEEHALPAEQPAEGPGLLPVADAAAQVGSAQHAQQAGPAVKPIRGSRELNTLLRAAAALPMYPPSAAPLCHLAAGQTRAHNQAQPTAAGALPCTSAAEAHKPPRPQLAKGLRELKALSASMHPSGRTPYQSVAAPGKGRAQSMLHLTSTAAAPSKAASPAPEPLRPKAVSGLRELLALGACHARTDHMPDHSQQVSGRTRAHSAAQPGAARDAPSQPAIKPSQPTSPSPARGCSVLRPERVQQPRLRATPCRRGPRHAAEPAKPEPLRGCRELEATCINAPRSGPPASRQDSNKAQSKSKPVRGIRELLALRSHAPSSACMPHPAQRTRLQPVRGLKDIARGTRARGRLPLLRPSGSSKRLSSASNVPTERQLRRRAPSGKPFPAAP